VRPGSGEPARLFETGTEWLRGEGDGSDVVLSSRVRLARNLAGVPFPSRGSPTDRRHALESCKEAILSSSIGGASTLWVDLHDAPGLERTLLVERHLISKQHARGPRGKGANDADYPRGVAVALPGERASVMVNEEDHLRMQVIRSGLALDAALEEADALDDRLEARLDFAYSPRFGYLTACPTNVGTGVRLSVMLHLPALRMTGEIDKVKRAAADMSLAVRGFYGEGSEASGDFYRISNQTTLGKTERVLLHEMQREIIPRVVEYERDSRRQLLTRRRALLEDQVCRPLGVLRHARVLATEEALKLLSLVRLGVSLGLVEGVELRTIHHLMLLVQPAHLQRALKKELDQNQRSVERAAMVRARLA